MGMSRCAGQSGSVQQFLSLGAYSKLKRIAPSPDPNHGPVSISLMFHLYVLSHRTTSPLLFSLKLCHSQPSYDLDPF